MTRIILGFLVLILNSELALASDTMNRDWFDFSGGERKMAPSTQPAPLRSAPKLVASEGGYPSYDRIEEAVCYELGRHKDYYKDIFARCLDWGCKCVKLKGVPAIIREVLEDTGVISKTADAVTDLMVEKAIEVCLRWHPDLPQPDRCRRDRDGGR